MRKIDSGVRLEREVVALLSRQDNSDVCETLSKCASMRYELEAKSTARAGAIAGTVCNMMQLWGTVRDEALKRTRAINSK